MNWVLIVTMLALAVFGVAAIYSCTYMREAANYQNMWKSQTVWIGLGCILFLVASLTHYRWVLWGALPIYIGSLTCLVITLAMGKTVSNAARWLHIGPIAFQPSQLAVISGILVIALFLSQFRQLHPMLKLFACGALAGAPMLLVFKQPDLGTTMIWVPVFFALMFVGRIPKRYLIVLILLIVTAIPLAYYFVLKDYHKERIAAYLDPNIDPLGKRWAINNILIAVGSGGWGGKGFKAPNTQVELGNVPENTVPNDFIFAPIGEQGGFLASVALVGGLGLLVGCCLLVAFTAADDLGVLLATGVGVLIFTHTFQNIGMCLDIMPITGVPLPLISYSGTFIVIIMSSLGLVNSVWVHRKAL